LDLYASVESTDLYLNGNKHDIVHKISAVSDNAQYKEFLSPNTWGISVDPSAVDNPTTQSWFGFPSEPAQIYETYSATEANHKVGTLYFGTYITPNLVNKETKEGYGTYSGVTINYTAIAHPIGYNINYLKNTTDSVTNMPSDISDSTYDETITLSSNVPKRTGYNFKGWCDGVVTTDITTHTDICDGTIYNPDGSGTNLTYIIDQTISPNRLNLSAMWQEIPYTYSITYNKNTEDEVVSMPENVAETTTYDNPITLSSTEPTRNNYKFMGWCTAPVSDGESCDSPNAKYLPGTSYSLTRSDTNNIILYAIWSRPTVYDKVANLVKTDANGNPRTQTASDLKAVITKPTSNDPATDTSNSGVYLYDESTFGTAADSNQSDGTRANIYYYRGILDSNLDETSSSSYGSNGDGLYYPNYVILDANGTKDATDTCWRIVRTTASGGVKMIYNGTWDTTNNTCAHAQTGAQLATQAFGLKGNSTQSTYWYKNINRVGYTFNNDASIQDNTTATSVGTVFGSNDNYGVNGENSNIKNYIETWFAGSNGISAYESILEPNAGYCNDRSAFSDTSGSTALTTIPPYATAGAGMYFGSYTRNFLWNGNKTLTLSCPHGVVDLYTYKTDNNTNLNGGNGQLTKPIALITADESALAGSGYGGRTTDSYFSSNYSFSSYLHSGSHFWLLSPYRRGTNGDAYGFHLSSTGLLTSSYVISAYGVRPAISLTSGTIYSSGTGTATDPWLIQPNSNQAPEATEPLGVMEENNNSWQTLKIVLLALSIISISFYILVLIQKIKNHNKEVEE